MTKKQLGALLLVAMILAAIVVVYVQVTASSERPTHSAIRISSNDEFTADNGVVGGSGTQQDPFVISGWRIVPAPQPAGKPWAWDCAIDIRDSSAHFRIQDVNIVNGEVGDGILLVNAQYGEIRDCAIDADGVAVHILRSSEINISASSLGAGGWPSLWFAESANISVKDSLVATTWTGTGDQFTAFSPDSTGITFRNCTIGGEIRLRNCSGGSVTENSFTTARGGLVLEGSTNISIAGNIFEHRGIFFAGGASEHEAEYFSEALTNTIDQDNLVGNKRIEVHADETGVKVDRVDIGELIVMNSTAVEITNSTFSNSDSGILIIRSYPVLIDNCTATNCRIGIRLVFCSEINITRSEVIDNSAAGIALNSCWGMVVHGNEIKNNGGSPQLYVSVEDGGWGLLLYECEQALVYHNNFENNEVQAGDVQVGRSDNVWNSGYPEGGNFWSDFHGIDQYSGPGQNLTGADGIGDTPYGVGHDYDESSVDSYDRYPLMNRASDL